MTSFYLSSAFVSNCSHYRSISSHPTVSSFYKSRTLPLHLQACHARRQSRLLLGSAFLGISKRKLCSPSRANASSISMIVDPWSVSPQASDALAAQLFAVSLFPYIAFLYFLNKEEVSCPKLANFGFRFLLLFVGATIPAGIYAKLHYHDILANIDWLHGGAESLLTITNLLIVLGFREVIEQSANANRVASSSQKPSAKLNASVLPFLGGMAALAFSALPSHLEPGNALSFPTWIIHVSSLLEWLVAMGLVWRYADVSGNQRWKGLTWGMLPLHTSGICACTYHLFYNAPSLNVLVALQAFLTCFGNITMAAAAFRIFKGGATAQSSAAGGSVPLVGFEDLGESLESDSNTAFLTKVFVLSAIGSAAVKWGSLYIDQPFEPSLAVALALIFVPTGLNMMKWIVRSRSSSSEFGGFL